MALGVALHRLVLLLFWIVDYLFLYNFTPFSDLFHTFFHTYFHTSTQKLSECIVIILKSCIIIELAPLSSLVGIFKRAYTYSQKINIDFLYLSDKICQRGLKPENVLLCKLDNANPSMKITDMYHSKLLDLGTVLNICCCTPQSITPACTEDSTYTLKVDYFTTSLSTAVFPPFLSEFYTFNLNKKKIISQGGYGGQHLNTQGGLLHHQVG